MANTDILQYIYVVISIQRYLYVFHPNLGQGAPATGPIVIYVRVIRIGLCRSSVAVTKQLSTNNNDFHMNEKYYSFNVTLASSPRLSPFKKFFD